MWLVWPWMQMRVEHGWWVPAVGGTLWGALLVSFLVTMYWPGRKRYGDEAMALGMVGMAAMFVVLVLMVLLVGVLMRWTGMVNVISFMAMMLALLIMPQYWWAKIQDRRKAWKGVRLGH